MDEPKIEFPCDYPVKVIVEAGENIVQVVIDIVKTHDDRLTPEKISQNPSRNGKYTSVRFDLWATGKPQLEALFTDLKKCEAVRMVL